MPVDDDQIDLHEVKQPAVRAITWMAVVGAAIGIAFGLLGATVFTAMPRRPSMRAAFLVIARTAPLLVA